MFDHQHSPRRHRRRRTIPGLAASALATAALATLLAAPPTTSAAVTLVGDATSSTTTAPLVDGEGTGLPTYPTQADAECVVWDSLRPSTPALLSPSAGAVLTDDATIVPFIVHLPRTLPTSATIEIHYDLARPASGSANGVIRTALTAATSRPLCLAENVRDLSTPYTPPPAGAPTERQVRVMVPRSARSTPSPTATIRSDHYRVRILDGTTEIANIGHVHTAAPSTGVASSNVAAIELGAGVLTMLSELVTTNLATNSQATFTHPKVTASFLGSERQRAVEGFMGGDVVTPDPSNTAYVGLKLTADRVLSSTSEGEIDARGVTIYAVLQLGVSTQGRLTLSLPSLEWGRFVENRCGVRNDGPLRPYPYPACMEAQAIGGAADAIRQKIFASKLAEGFNAQLSPMIDKISIGQMVPQLRGTHTFAGPVTAVAGRTDGVTLTLGSASNGPPSLGGCSIVPAGSRLSTEGYVGCRRPDASPATVKGSLAYDGSPQTFATSLPLSSLRTARTPTGIAAALRPEVIDHLLGTVSANGMLNIDANGVRLRPKAAPYVDRPATEANGETTISIAVPGIEIEAGSVHAIVEARLVASVKNQNGGMAISRLAIVAGSVRVTALNQATTAAAPVLTGALNLVAGVLDPVLCGVLIPSNVGLCSVLPAPLGSFSFQFGTINLAVRPVMARGSGGSVAAWIDFA